MSDPVGDIEAGIGYGTTGDEHDAALHGLGELLAERQQAIDALRQAIREWHAWMESARLGYDDEVPTQDDFDLYDEVCATLAALVKLGEKP